SGQQLWITDIYLFLLAGFLITMGTVGDRIGRRRLLLLGAGAFTLASILAAYSVSPEMLIVARALLGVAAATMSPSTLALISNMFRDDRQRGPRDLGLGDLHVRRWRARTGDRWGAPEPLVVGLGVPARGAGHGGADGRRTAAA